MAFFNTCVRQFQEKLIMIMNQHYNQFPKEGHSKNNWTTCYLVNFDTPEDNDFIHDKPHNSYIIKSSLSMDRY